MKCWRVFCFVLIMLYTAVAKGCSIFKGGKKAIIIMFIASTLTGNGWAGNPDQLYKHFLAQQMMIAKIREFNGDQTVSSLKESLSQEAQAVDMHIPDWFRCTKPLHSTNSSEHMDKKGINRLIESASLKYGVDGTLIKAVVQVESAYNANAISSAGAKGLMQIMDSTGAGIGLMDPFDPKANIYCGTRLLAKYLRKYLSVKKSLIAYNAGEKYVTYPYHKLPRETQNYIVKVLICYQKMKIK